MTTQTMLSFPIQKTLKNSFDFVLEEKQDDWLSFSAKMQKDRIQNTLNVSQKPLRVAKMIEIFSRHEFNSYTLTKRYFNLEFCSIIEIQYKNYTFWIDTQTVTPTEKKQYSLK